ncbi:DUF4349 domain-containing protein [Microbulbifer sp. CAU 1566]|uniref:DUF4349 domain-containing protein n=1 Tax=Microbulbifer sp. CAU 1566 TaxID=2933269 RepID=UPI0020064B43|nr:DUF4349 domain-containing protein [Microbulbifer sp. CAU 1566]MCK7598990.1 DUF4349 domain-containing protein [Microbulbifer sp. CAU 1566]
MNLRYLIALLAFAVLVSGCSSSEDDSSAEFSDIRMGAQQEEKNKYLAYTHRISIDLPVNKVKDRYDELVEWCVDDREFKCMLLDSSLSTSNFVHAKIRVRIVPEGVVPYLTKASDQGSTTEKSTEVEDLAESIVDNQKRLEMLSDYRDKLEALSERSDGDVEALVKIASELAKVQSDLEYSLGKKAHLMQRVEMDVVNLNLFSRSQKSFWRPIGESISEFGSNLSEGISSVITIIAYLIPWTILLSIIVFVARKLWVRRKRL